eukprot:gene11934-13170_t
MQRIFKTVWDEEISGIILKERAFNATCAWSTRNLIAFTTGFMEAFEVDSSGNHVLLHIACPENPNEVYHLETGLKEPIHHILWDRTSTRLLIIDICGNCKVFQMCNSMMNCWKCIHCVDIGSKIVCVSWLEREPKFVYDAKPGSVNMFEKFCKKISKPPLADIAGISKDGFVAVTETGIAQVAILNDGESLGKVSKTRLFINHPRVLLGDICFKDDGKVCIALATDQRVVEFCILTLRMQMARVEISFETSPCITPHTIGDDEYQTYQITNIRFSNESKLERLLICTETALTTCLKYFELKLTTATLQPVLQRRVQNPSQKMTKEWTCVKSSLLPTNITCIAISNVLCAGDVSTDSVFFPSIMLTTTQGMLHKLTAENFTEVFSADLVDATCEAIQCLIFSPTDTCAFIITDKGNVMMLLASSFQNVNDATVIKLASSLFQYCITAGQSAWDVGVLLALQGDKVAEQCQALIRKDIASQSAMVEELTFISLANVQADIYKGLYGVYYGSLECRDVILLKWIYNYVHSAIMLMPSDRESQIAWKIKNVLGRQLEIELPKLMQLLEVKDIPFNAALISSLQHVMEWITSYAVRVCKMILLANSGGNSKPILSTLTISGLRILRELLVLMYTWGQALPCWQPHFLESGSPLDLLAQIFKVVSKLLQGRENNSTTMDSIVSIDEIPMRAHPQMYESLPLFDPKSGVLSQCQFLHEHDNEFDVYTFDSQERTMRLAMNYSHPSPLAHETDIYRIKPGDVFYDAVNLITTTLMKGETLKQCVQCNCLTLSIVHQSRVLLSTWREQWVDGCFCGGLWKSLHPTREMATIKEAGTKV